ncbi:MAG: pilus assembly protein PilM [bacterium JZ-2024 1]
MALLKRKRKAVEEEAGAPERPARTAVKRKGKRTKAMVGFDFLANQARIVQLGRVGKETRLERVAIVDLPADAFRMGKVGNVAGLTETLGNAMSEASINGTYAAIALSGINSVVRILSLPKMSRTQLRETIEVQLSQFIPFPPEDTIYQYRILEEYTEDEAPMYEILLTGARYSVVGPLVRAIMGLGLTPVSVKVGYQAALSVLKRYYEDYAQAVAFVDIREKFTDIGFVSDNSFKFSRSVELGLETMLARIATMVGLTPKELERQIRETEVDFMGDAATMAPEQARLSEAFRASFQAFGNELIRSVRYYEAKSRKKVRVGRIILSGAFAGMSNLDTFLSEMVAVDCVIADPLENIDYSMAEWYPADYRAFLGEIVIPLGVAADALNPVTRRDTNLLPREFLVRKKITNVAVGVVGIVAIAFIYGFAVSKSLDAKIASAQESLTKWTNENAKVEPGAKQFDAVMADVQKLAPKLQSVAILFGRQLPWSLLMEEIRSLIPQNVWLSQSAGGSSEALGIDLTSLPRVTIKGQSVGLEPMFRFAKRIYESKLFVGDVSVEFDVASQAGGGGGAAGGGGGARRMGPGMKSPLGGSLTMQEPDQRDARTGVFGDIGSIERYFREGLPSTVLYNFTFTFDMDTNYITPSELRQKFTEMFQGGGVGGGEQPAAGAGSPPPAGAGGNSPGNSPGGNPQ